MIVHFLAKSLSDTLSGRGPILAARAETTKHPAHLAAGAGWLMRSIEDKIEIYLALRDLQPRIELDEELRRRAELPLVRMLELS